MNYSLPEDGVELVFAAQYLQAAAFVGKALPLRQLGLTIYCLSDCLCLGENHQTVLPARVQPLRLIFRESCQYLANEHDLAPMARRLLETKPEFKEIDEAAALYYPGSDNLWHWMAEGLPKLLALESIGYTGQYIVAESAVVRQTLDMLSIDPGRVLPGKACYRVKRLMLPQRLSGFDLAECMPLTALVREKIRDAVGVLPGARRVYVRRIGRRKPINEGEVLAVLRDFDFEIMTPEDHGLAEQLRYMTNVECSVMAHGANAALTLMQKNGSGFVELFNNRYVNYNNLHAVRLLRLRYYPLVQDLDLSTVPLDGTSLPEFVQSGYTTDIDVDVIHLRIALESLLA